MTVSRQKYNINRFESDEAVDDSKCYLRATRLKTSPQRNIATPATTKANTRKKLCSAHTSHGEQTSTKTQTHTVSRHILNEVVVDRAFDSACKVFDGRNTMSVAVDRHSENSSVGRMMQDNEIATQKQNQQHQLHQTLRDKTKSKQHRPTTLVATSQNGQRQMSNNTNCTNNYGQTQNWESINQRQTRSKYEAKPPNPKTQHQITDKGPAPATSYRNNKTTSRPYTRQEAYTKANNQTTRNSTKLQNKPRKNQTKNQTNKQTAPVEIILNSLIGIRRGLLHLAKRSNALLIVGQRTQTNEICAVTKASDVNQEIELFVCD